MKILKSIGILLAFLALGEGVSIAIGHFIPGSVIGMLLLFAALCLGWIKPESIRAVATFLTDNMTIFFIPAFAGIIDQWGLIKVHFTGWVIVLVLTTAAVMFTSGSCAELLARRAEKKKEKKNEEQ